MPAKNIALENLIFVQALSMHLARSQALLPALQDNFRPRFNIPEVSYTYSSNQMQARAWNQGSVQGVAWQAHIKWPNDIYVNQMKIGGILCQSICRDGVFHVVVGVGLNVNNSEPTTCLADLVHSLRGERLPTGRKDISSEVRTPHLTLARSTSCKAKTVHCSMYEFSYAKLRKLLGGSESPLAALHSWQFLW